jgi:hypothetical protein
VEVTTNLGLKKPGDNGILDIEIIDTNMDIIDAAVAGLQDGKEPAFIKNSGFNKNKSDSYSLDDSNILATSKAVKIAYDKGVEALSIANGKQAAGTYNTTIGTDTDVTTSGATIIDRIYVTDGVITSMGTRTLTAGDLAAISDAGKLFTSNGYQKLSNGLILQWGISGTANLSNNSFPIAFPNACLVMAGNPLRKQITCYMISISNTTYQKHTNITNDSDFSTACSWIAIGY